MNMKIRTVDTETQLQYLFMKVGQLHFDALVKFNEVNKKEFYDPSDNTSLDKLYADVNLFKDILSLISDKKEEYKDEVKEINNKVAAEIWGDPDYSFIKVPKHALVGFAEILRSKIEKEGRYTIEFEKADGFDCVINDKII